MRGHSMALPEMDLTPTRSCLPPFFSVQDPKSLAELPSSQLSTPYLNQVLLSSSPLLWGEGAVVLTMSSVCAWIQTPPGQEPSSSLRCFVLDPAPAGSPPNLLDSAQVCLFRTPGCSPVQGPKSVSELTEDRILFPESR